jgi:organic hydroperoxide reductase OsmC/OhrA
MAEYSATVEWSRNGALFLDNRYSRVHCWRFDGGVEVRASASPHVVPTPMSDLQAIDPEEAFVASLSSCHMLWFLSIAAKRSYVVDRYLDLATAVMGKDSTGKLAITCVSLHPEVQFSGDNRPGMDEQLAMHHSAHDHCFIANSVKSELRCEPVFT